MSRHAIALTPLAFLLGCSTVATVGAPTDESRCAIVKTVLRGVEQASPGLWYAFIDRIDGEEVDYPGWDVHRPSVAQHRSGHPIRVPAGVHTIDGLFGTRSGTTTGVLPEALAVPFHGRFFARPGHTYDVVVTIAIGESPEELQRLGDIGLSAGVQVNDTTDVSVSPVSLTLIGLGD
jgi:hypothetical protein